MSNESLIGHLALVGDYLSQHATGDKNESPSLRGLNQKFFNKTDSLIKQEHLKNPWFTEAFVRKAIMAISSVLKEALLLEWVGRYPSLPAAEENRKTVGLVMAGNIPFVGFHDFVSVFLSGHHMLLKPSSKDDRLIRHFAELIISLRPDDSKRIHFIDDHIAGADAYIATGSNNTSRYFEYYFKDRPHIIRKNRNAVAILDGREDEKTLELLGEDIFTYFGLGCRNVTKIYMPENYDPAVLLKAFEKYSSLSNHHKYANNLDYQRTVYLMNRIPFLDNGVLLLREEQKISSPVGVVFYEKYSELDSLLSYLDSIPDQLQCIVSANKDIAARIAPGMTQFPDLWDYADNVDTMRFLTKLTGKQ